ncbi:tripartite motif-containing protein 42-like [Haliotis rufescens]|uniref:tripartite motif-containing protein 42-like n=1 Tax=Haliotis rufescens TaxID=6454 RepID=UPI00201E9A64|nr:tripartite motif-containing protein 42-like [Haliotis rufescens]
MAVHRQLTDNFLTCSICMDVFDVPCTLVCYHTFCRKCVVSYTKTRPEAISAKSLLCPFCRKMTKVANSNRPVEEWAQEVKPSFLIQGLLDSFNPKTKDTPKCILCSDEGAAPPATAWCADCDISLCEGCQKAHRRIPATRHHDVSDLSTEVKINQRRKPFCKQHPDQSMQFYCKDCKKLQCQSCCILYHRKCEAILPFESVMPELISCVTGVKERLASHLQATDSLLTELETKRTEVIKNRVTVQCQIRSTIQTVTEAIKKKQRQLLDQLDDATEKHIERLKTEMKSEEMAKQMISHHSVMIDRALESGSEMDIYEIYLWCESEEFPTVYDPDSDIKYELREKVCFKHDCEEMCNNIHEVSFGEIDTIYEDVFDSTSTSVLHDTVDTQTEDETSLPHVYDVAVFNEGGTDTIVVTDNNNKCVKSFYTRNTQPCQSKLSVQSPPRRIAKLNAHHMAVTLPETREIILIEVTPDLVLQSYISTRKKYFGLTALTPTTLAAGSGSPPCVDILDMAGNVLRTLNRVTDGGTLVSDPLFLSTTSQGYILVSCSHAPRSHVLCMTPNGDVVFNYVPTGQHRAMNPCGITGTNTGDMLVVDDMSNKVVHLSSSGTWLRDVLTSSDGITFPYGLYFDKRRRLYVTNRHCVMVYRFITRTKPRCT